MTAGDRRLIDYLGHILSAIERIRRYTAGMSEQSFLRNELVQDAVIRNLEIIGEASRKIMTGFPNFCAAHPDIPFASAYQMRNAIAHGYFATDFEIVWRTLLNDLPGFEAKLLAVKSART
jgi:uncharacterized protein with HEPN domain